MLIRGFLTLLCLLASPAFAAGGHIGLSINGTLATATLDDFGGGNVTAATALQSPPMPPIVFQ